MNNLLKKIHPLKDFFINLSQKDFRIFFTTFLIVATGWLFVVISAKVSSGSTLKFDQTVIEFFREPGLARIPTGPKELTTVMRDITALGSASVIFIITVIVSGFLLLKKDYHSFFLVLFAIIGGALLETSLKELFGRERPQLIYHLVEEYTLSFPSGHSMMSAVVYLSLAVLVSRTLIRRVMRMYVIIIALILSFLIGFSRIYLGVHYPTDVLGGWTLGLFWAGICWLVWYYTERVFIKK